MQPMDSQSGTNENRSAFERHLSELIAQAVKQALKDAGCPTVLPSEKPDVLDQLIDKQQAARYLGITIRTLEAWMHRGLPYYKIHRVVRFRRRAIMEYLEAKWSPGLTLQQQRSNE
jgi:excisionase family DNA binding protein